MRRTQVRSILFKALLFGVLFTALAFGQSAEPPVTPVPAESESAASAPALAAPSTDESASAAAQPVSPDGESVAAVSEESAQETAQETAAAEPSASEESEKTETIETTETAHKDDEDDEECAEGEECDDLVAGDAEESDAEEDAEEALAYEEEDEDVEDGEETAVILVQPDMRLGVLSLESLTGHDDLASELTKALVSKLDELGLYTVFNVENAFNERSIRVPSNCREPKCVHDVGKTLGFDRMIYGTVDKNGSRFGVRLTLLDVLTSSPIETINIQGDPGIGAEDVLFHAVDRLHGHEGDPEFSRYFGPPISNLRELMWSAAAVQLTGLFYSALNYGVGSGRADGIEYVTYGKGKLSGIAATADQIPMFARPAALANAYVAASDDAYGVLYNPAGLAWVAHREAAGAYQYRFGLDLLAATYANKATRDLGFGHALLISTDRDGMMTEMHFISAAGYKFNNTPIGPVSFGAAFKTISNTVKALSPDSPKGQSIGAGLDLGLMWEMSEKIRYGMLFRGVPAVNSWKNRATSEHYYEAHPATLTMGGSYRSSYSSFFIAEGQIPLYEDQPWVMAGGIEYEFFRMIAMRVGLQREILDEESNSWKITGGTGIKFNTEPVWGKSLTLDAAYEYNTLHLFPVVNVSLKVGF